MEKISVMIMRFQVHWVPSFFTILRKRYNFSKINIELTEIGQFIQRDIKRNYQYTVYIGSKVLRVAHWGQS